MRMRMSQRLPPSPPELPLRESSVGEESMRVGIGHSDPSAGSGLRWAGGQAVSDPRPDRAWAGKTFAEGLLLWLRVPLASLSLVLPLLKPRTSRSF